MMSPSILSTAVDCGTLPDPVNGQVNDTAGTTFGQTATYSCNTGYDLVGNSTHMCQTTGVWSGLYIIELKWSVTLGIFVVIPVSASSCLNQNSRNRQTVYQYVHCHECIV